MCKKGFWRNLYFSELGRLCLPNWAITDCQIHGSSKRRKLRSKTGKSLKRVRDWSTAEGVRERWDCPVTPGNDRADEWSGSGSAQSPAAAKLTQRPDKKRKK